MDLLSTYGILGLVLMYLMANIALIAAGLIYLLALQATRPRALSQAVSKTGLVNRPRAR